MNDSKELPPPKNYGGEDIETFFAEMLLDQIVTMIFAKTRSTTANIFQGMDKLIADRNSIEGRLKKNNDYFYASGGSVFMDYKRTRDLIFPEDGQLTGWGNANIRPDMSTQQALEICKKQVKTWWK